MKDYVNVKPARKPWVSSNAKLRCRDVLAMLALALILCLEIPL